MDSVIKEALLPVHVPQVHDCGLPGRRDPVDSEEVEGAPQPGHGALVVALLVEQHPELVAHQRVQVADAVRLQKPCTLRQWRPTSAAENGTLCLM